MQPSVIPTSNQGTIVPKPYSLASIREGMTVTTTKFFTRNDCHRAEDPVSGNSVIVCPLA